MEVRSNFRVALHLDTFIQVSKWLIISRPVHTVLSWFSQRDASQWKSTWVTELSQGVSYQTSKVSVHLRVVKQRRQWPRWKEIVIRNSITAWDNLKVFIGLALWHWLKIISCCFQKWRLTIYKQRPPFGRKRSMIYVHGHHLFQKVNSFPKAKFDEKCEPWACLISKLK